MKLQVFSDFHLETRDISYPKPLCDTLILAGDMCSFDKVDSLQPFLMYVNMNWKKIIWVLGNHEYYSHSVDMSSISDYLKLNISMFPNIIILDRNIITIDDYIIMGCTLWSYVSENTEYLCKSAFKKLRVNGKSITRELYNELHYRDKNWLLENYNPDKNTILITHFPTQQEFTGDPKYNNDSKEIKDVYANCIDLTTNKKLLCISGHTHYNFFKIKDNIIYKSNQYGNQPEPINFFNKYGLMEL